MSKTDFFKDIYKIIADIENPYDIYQNNQAYLGFEIARDTTQLAIVKYMVKDALEEGIA